MVLSYRFFLLSIPLPSPLIYLSVKANDCKAEEVRKILFFKTHLLEVYDLIH